MELTMSKSIKGIFIDHFQINSYCGRCVEVIFNKWNEYSRSKGTFIKTVLALK